MWIGGCANGVNAGWHWYCLNREAYNTAGGYLRKASNERFAAQRAGYFRVNFCKALDLASLPLRHHLWAFLVTYSLAHVHLTSSGASRLPPLTTFDRITSCAALVLAGTIKYASGWSHNNVYVQGGLQYHSYMHTAGCWWQDDTIDHTFRAGKG